ncbi:ACR3 family arsenite efflux transporter [Mollicutes bacterium LVI A0039]|nr:ACR3 family arsenite efflux transporter [Mollicutes bacterium LVI A0039]
MENKISFFEKNLSVWVLICMVLGVFISLVLPQIPSSLNALQIAGINLPTSILLWFMIFPMLLKIDFQSIKNIRNNPNGLYSTWISNWFFQPITMFLIAGMFFYYIYAGILPADVSAEFFTGAIILGTAPCTAMVFVWSKLTNGNPAYTVVQTATNDLIILILFVPWVSLLLGVSDIEVPYSTLIASTVIFVLIPLVLSVLVRHFVIKSKGEEYLYGTVIAKFDKFTMIGLLLTLVLIFSYQGMAILSNPIYIALISIPLIIQAFLMYFISTKLTQLFKLPKDISAPAILISTSNFFELAVVVAIATYGIDSLVVLVCTVGVLVEVPLMLFLVKLINKKNGENNE